MLDRAHVAFSEESLLEGDELDYDVKWVDANIVDVAYEAVRMKELEEELLLKSRLCNIWGLMILGGRKSFFRRCVGLGRGWLEKMICKNDNFFIALRSKH